MEIIIDILKGAGSIILAMTPLLIPQVREFIIKKYQHSLDKSLEDRKANNERKNYVSKVKFDKEFEIFQELAEASYNFIEFIHVIDVDKQLKIGVDVYANLVFRFHQLEKSIFKNITFISKELAEKYIAFHELALDNVIEYSQDSIKSQIIKMNSDDLKSSEKIKLAIPIIEYKNIKLSEKAQKMTDLYEEITNDMRTYLQNLEVK